MTRRRRRRYPGMDPDCHVPAEPPLLPLLSLPEAHAALAVLAAVVHGEVVDRETARGLLMNLAARVPSVP